MVYRNVKDAMKSVTKTIEDSIYFTTHYASKKISEEMVKNTATLIKEVIDTQGRTYGQPFPQISETTKAIRREYRTKHPQIDFNIDKYLYFTGSLYTTFTEIINDKQATSIRRPDDSGTSVGSLVGNQIIYNGYSKVLYLWNDEVDDKKLISYIISNIYDFTKPPDNLWKERLSGVRGIMMEEMERMTYTSEKDEVYM